MEKLNFICINFPMRIEGKIYIFLLENFSLLFCLFLLLLLLFPLWIRSVALGNFAETFNVLKSLMYIQSIILSIYIMYWHNKLMYRSLIQHRLIVTSLRFLENGKTNFPKVLPDCLILFQINFLLLHFLRKVVRCRCRVDGKMFDGKHLEYGTLKDYFLPLEKHHSEKVEESFCFFSDY